MAGRVGNLARSLSAPSPHAHIPPPVSERRRPVAPARLARPWRASGPRGPGRRPRCVPAAAHPARRPPPAAPAAARAGQRLLRRRLHQACRRLRAGPEQQAITDLESRLGRRLHIDHHYYSWTDVFPSWREPWDIQNDRIPMISWNGENTDAIARGD